MRISRVPGRIALVAVCVILLAACSQSPHNFHLTNVTGHQPDLALFGAPTASGGTLSAQELRGQVVVLYFGYTHCPDICPTTLANLQAVRQRLGEAADELQVIFVTVDPKRDTPAVLKSFVNAFSPHFIALRPDRETLSKFAERYHIAFSYGKKDTSGNYSVLHSDSFFIFDQTGQMRLIGDLGNGIKAITSDVAYLIKHAS